MIEEISLKKSVDVLGQPHLRDDRLSQTWQSEREDAALRFPTVVHATEAWAQNAPNRTALIYLEPDGKRTRYSYHDLWLAACELAGTLTDCDVKQGDRIAVCSRASADVIVAYLAIMRIGAVVVPIDPRGAPDAATFFLQLTGCVLALVDKDGARILGRASITCRRLDERRVSADGAPSNLVALPASIQPAVILSTSGTTAEPKAPCLSHRNLIVNAEALRQVHDLTSDTVNLCVLPLFHANAFGFSFVTTLYAGARLVLCGGMQANITSILREEDVNVISLVPELIKILVNLPLSTRSHPKLEYVISAAAPLTVELAKTFFMRTGLRIQQGWGLSECTNFAATLPRDLTDSEYGQAMHSYDHPSIGPAIYGCDVDVLDPAGIPVAEAREGELVVKGANVMLGYWERPEYTTEAMGGAYLRTGDLGLWRMIGGRKMFFVTGRAKDLIIRCGEKISPAAVEIAMGDFARKYPILAVGFNNRHVGEEIGLYVQARYSSVLVQELKCALDELSETLRPRAIVVGKSEMPRTSTGKPQRAKLKPLFVSLAEQPHSHRRPTIICACRDVPEDSACSL